MRGSEVSTSVVKCSLVKCGEVWQCNGGTSNKVSNIIIRHIDNRKLLLICILLLSHSVIFFRFLFYKNMVVIYVFLLEEAIYSYCCLCILIVVCVLLFLSMYSYCCLCIVIFVYVLLLLSMYCYCCICIVIVILCILIVIEYILIVVYVFLDKIVCVEFGVDMVCVWWHLPSGVLHHSQQIRHHHGDLRVDSDSNRNENQRYILEGSKGGRCLGLTTLSPSCVDFL